MTTPLHGIWRIVPSPALTEIIAQSGFDFQILDAEHGGYDYQTLLTDGMACEANRCQPWIRVSGTDKVEVQRCLDLGARAIVFPQLATVDDFAAAAAMMDHAPAGVRGFNPFVRAYGYGTPGAPSPRPWCVPIIETLAAVEQLDRILQLERIDLIYIGSYDLSTQLGVAGNMEAPQLTQVFDHIFERCHAAGKRVGAMALSAAAIDALTGRGFDALVHGVESHRLKQAMLGIIPGARRAPAPPPGT